MLKETEYTTFELKRATRLKDGLKYLQETKFDAIILDLELPDSKRFRYISTGFKQHPEIPILIINRFSLGKNGCICGKTRCAGLSGQWRIR